MSFIKLICKSLSFYWRTNLSVLLAAVVTVAVLCGALLVGDSVRYSLRAAAEARLGRTEFALAGSTSFFRSALADDLAKELQVTVAPVLHIRGLISNSDGSRRANSVQVLGVEERFYQLGKAENMFGSQLGEGVVLNRPLAQKLGVQAGEEVVLRIAKPSLMPRDAPIGSDADLSIAFRITITAVADESAFGRFSLQANQSWPLNVFVPLEWLQDKIGRSGQANVVLVGKQTGQELQLEEINKTIGRCWRLADAGLELRRLSEQGCFEIRSRRVFISDNLSEAALQAADESVGVLSYFVNELRLGRRSTPYSMVAAVGNSGSKFSSIIPAGMKDNEIVINEWLAEDLEAKQGDSIELTYFVAGAMRKLTERKERFVVRGIVPIEGAAADRELMPEFPGLVDVDNCRDWQPGIPIDLDRIRQQDEEYWDKYKGTPKAFVTLQAGRNIWANRYGNLTAVRYPSNSDPERITENILDAVDPASVGLFFQPVRAEAFEAAEQATDFGQLFLGFSFFLIAAAAVLMGLIFLFGIESRTQQVGILKAMGFSAGQIKRLLLAEGAVLAVLGAFGGTIGGMLLTKAMIGGLASIWRTAVSGSVITFHAEISTLLIGGLMGVVISLGVVWLALVGRLRSSAHELLAGYPRWQFFGAGKLPAGKAGLLLAATAGAAAVAVLWVMALSTGRTAAGAFFAAGALLLLAGLGLSQWLLSLLSGGLEQPAESLPGLSLRNMTRRRGRSLAVVWLLACGVFLVVAVGANRHDPASQAGERHSGTGGFELFGESTVSILHDLNSADGRNRLGLEADELGDVDIIQLRSYEGDEASCLNLNRAGKPRVLGVNPERLASLDAFAFTKTIESASRSDGWEMLEDHFGRDVVPGVGDSATITWALGKSVGDKIDYVDQRGRQFSVLIVGIIKTSILQGSLVISEEHFVERFSGVEGYQTFLIDVPEKRLPVVISSLGRTLRDFGLELTPAVEKLAGFIAVENTYLSIFQLLGGLGLVLGSGGVGLVVLRNVLDRRGELAMLRAVGFERNWLTRMIFYEHTAMFSAGLVIGLVSGLVAVGPVLISAGAQVPYLSVALTIAAILLSGMLWIWLAATLAMKGEMLGALRNE